jgi:uncharacterized integral membrane protein (TIGR00698 family)
MNNQASTPLLWQKLLFGVILLATLAPQVSVAMALLLGILMALTVGNPFPFLNNNVATHILKVSVVGLGFGMNADSVIEAGQGGLLLVTGTIVSALVLAYFLGKWLNVDKIISYLIGSGTAICGGSAIAAVAPVIRANEKQISVALGVVFILNAIALFVFPAIGEWLQMSQAQFGMWAAVAIHDTSSVVGAAAAYGEEALAMATTVKLTRALWIIPLALISTRLFKGDSKKVKIPRFIGFFILAVILGTYVPFVENLAPYLVKGAKSGLSLTLFLIGAGLSLSTIKSIGVKPLLQAITVWILVSVATLSVILNVNL